MSVSCNNTYCKTVHNNTELKQHLKYKEKYYKLKKLIKNTIIENAALCDQVAQMQNCLVDIKDERLILLRKLCHLQGEINSSTFLTKSQMGNDTILINSNVTLHKKCLKKKNNIETLEIKSKSKKSNKVARKLVQLIPLDVHGRPVFPISLGDLTVYSLGDVIIDRMGYHTEDFIYPVGYCSTRVYASLRNARVKSLYTCKILDGGLKPRFEIVSDTELNKPLVGLSPDECHSLLLSAISPSLKNVVPKGADFFGISHPTIQNLIQSSPGTRKLSTYKQQKFEVSKNSSDKDINLLTEEENDPGLSFAALHKYYDLSSTYSIKQEQKDHDLLNFQEFLT